MKKYIFGFVLRGLAVCALGPVVWAIVYAILGATGAVDSISVQKMVLEVVSVTLLAFIAGGIGVVYKVERLPLVAATLIHALVLYVDYVVIYLMNGWLGGELASFLVFTGCFIVGFVAIWLTVYFTTKKSTDEINSKLASMQAEGE